MHTERPRLRILRGPRLAEDLLFEELLFQGASPELAPPIPELGAEQSPETSPEQVEVNPGWSKGLRERMRHVLRPVRILVPSHSMRLHLTQQLVARRGPILGIQVLTLHRAAEEILERSGEHGSGGGALFDVLVRRIASEDSVLSRSLSHLEDGYGSVGGSIRELLDAGLDPHNLEALEEALATAEKAGKVSLPHRQRAEALLRVAAECMAQLKEKDIQRPSSMMARAAELVRVFPELFPASRICVLGFGEAPGITIDFLEAIVKGSGLHCPVTIYLDEPPDPADPELPDPSGRITERLQERLEPLCSLERVARLASPPQYEVFSAPGAIAEAREVAFRTHKLLESGVSPEQIAIVARELPPYRNALRTQLQRLGVPWSGVGEPGPPNAPQRLARAMLDLLRDRGDVGVDRWLATLITLPPKPGHGPLFSQRVRLARHDLRVALKVVGASRLSEVADIVLADVAPDGKLALPARRGMESRNDDGEAEDQEEVQEEPEEVVEEVVEEASKAAPMPLDPMLEGLFDANADPESLDPEVLAAAKALDAQAAQVQVSGDVPAGEGGGKPAKTPGIAGNYVSRRYYPADKLERVIAAARSIRDRLRNWKEEGDAEGGAPIRRHVELLAGLIDELGWLRIVAGVSEVKSALTKVDWGIPSDLRLSMDEFVLLVGKALERVMPHKLGGEGGGVQVLSVPEARERTFKHLFLMGLNRDQFPRSVREDPLLPDAVRRVIQEILPDLALKMRGFDEERYFFASLSASAPLITFSYQIVDEDGNARPLSPLLERVKLARKLDVFRVPPVIPGVLPLDYDERVVLRPAMEHAILAGIHADRGWFRKVLAVALSEMGAPDPESLASARVAILDEMDPDRRTKDGWETSYLPGPYLGFVGPVQEKADPRHEVPHLTLLENIAVCGWQVMLLRVMRLEEVPDPTLSLPAFERALIGTVVHKTLETIVRDAFAAAGKEFPTSFAAATESVVVPWPDAAWLEAMTRTVASDVMRNRGVGIPGFDQILADHALPILENVRSRDWKDQGGINMLGVELEGVVPLKDIEGKDRELPFIADRVDAGWFLTEYKTGKTISEAKKELTRRGHLAKKMATGERLQAIAYVLAARAIGAQDPEGRFLFVGTKTPDEGREFRVNMQDVPMIQTFERVAQTTLDAWDKGSLLPRIVEPDKNVEPGRCKWCSVAAACSRRDSGTRSRINRVNELWTSKPPQTPLEASWYRLWRISLGETP